MKRSLSFFVVLLSLTAAVGCTDMKQSSEVLPQESPNHSVSAETTKEAQGETSQSIDTYTEEVDLPPEETDCLAVANECASAFQQLYRNYFNAETRELSIKISNDFSLLINENGCSFLPVIDDEIKCCDDLKKILLEHCTDEFAQMLMDHVIYRDFDGKLYKAHEIGQVDPGRWQFGCYIDDCALDGNKMTVYLISIGTENENFDIDPEYYNRLYPYDVPFEMTLVWENERWLISDISNYYDYVSYIPFSYREDITRSMHEAN